MSVTIYRTTFTTDTAIEVAFDYLSRFSTAAEWDPGVVEARDLTPDPVGVGSAFHVVSAVGPLRAPLRYEIVEFQRPTRVVLRAENWSVTSTDTITFAPIAEAGDVAHGPGVHTARSTVPESPTGTTGTAVTYQADLRPRGVTRLVAPLVAVGFRRIGDRAAAGLRSAVHALGEPDRRAAPSDAS